MVVHQKWTIFTLGKRGRMMPIWVIFGIVAIWIWMVNIGFGNASVKLALPYTSELCLTIVVFERLLASNVYITPGILKFSNLCSYSVKHNPTGLTILKHQLHWLYHVSLMSSKRLTCRTLFAKNGITCKNGEAITSRSFILDW